MGISDTQHRYMVGMNNRNKGVSTFSFKYQSKFMYRFNNFSKTLADLLTDSRHNNYCVNGLAPFYALLFYCIIVCMFSCLSIQINISKLTSIVATGSTNIFVSSHCNSNTLYSSLINWAVVILYFSRSNTTGHNILYQCYRLAKYAPKANKLKKN